MTDKELEMLFKNSNELEPKKELKEKILMRASAEEAKSKRSGFSLVAKRMIPIAACFALILGLVGGFFGFKNEEYQTVFVDVNPSVALHVNRFGDVSGVELLNDDARAALGDVDLKGLSAEDALEKMIKVYKKLGYLKKGAALYLTAVSEKNKNADKLLEKMIARAEKENGNKDFTVNVNKLTAEDKALAEEHGISPGKYHVIEKVIEKYPEYTVDDLKEKSMGELNSMLKKEK